MDEQDIVVKLMERYTASSAKKSGLHDNMSLIKSFIDPHYGTSSEMDNADEYGSIQDLLDSTVQDEFTDFVDFTFSNLLNPSHQWIKYVSPVIHLDDAEHEQVMGYLIHRTEVLRKAIDDSNFYSEAYRWVMYGLLYGFSAMTVFEDEEGDLRHRTESPFKVSLDENLYGEVEDIFYTKRLKARDLIDRYENVPQEIINKEESSHNIYEIVFCMTKNLHNTKSKKKYAQYEILRGFERELLKPKKGYKEFYNMPCVVFRMKRGETPYGRGVGGQLLPKAQMINRIKQQILYATELVLDPPYNAPIEGSLRDGAITPGTIFYYDPILSQSKLEPVPIKADIPVGYDAIEFELNSVYSILAKQDREIQKTERQTAFEIAQLIEKRNKALAPYIFNFVEEGLKAYLERVDELLDLKGAFEPAPEVMKENPELEYEVLSPIITDQKLVRLNNLGKAMSLAAPFIQLDETAALKIKSNKGIAEAFQGLGYADLLRTEEEFEAELEKRQEQQKEAEKAATRKDYADARLKEAQATESLLPEPHEREVI